MATARTWDENTGFVTFASTLFHSTFSALAMVCIRGLRIAYSATWVPTMYHLLSAAKARAGTGGLNIASLVASAGSMFHLVFVVIATADSSHLCTADSIRLVSAALHLMLGALEMANIPDLGAVDSVTPVPMLFHLVFAELMKVDSSCFGPDIASLVKPIATPSHLVLFEEVVARNQGLCSTDLVTLVSVASHLASVAWTRTRSPLSAQKIDDPVAQQPALFRLQLPALLDTGT